MKSSSFEKLAGWAAVLAGVSGFIYAVSFVIVTHNTPELGHLLSAKFLLLGGMLSLPVFIALYVHFKETDEALATLALVLGIMGALGAMIHGAYDLANAINIPASIPTNQANLPNAIDPRGFLTFGITGLATLLFAWFMQEHHYYSKNLAFLGAVLGLLLLIIYIGRLTLLDAGNPVIVYPAVATGFVISPVWYIWLGATLLKSKK